MKKLIFMAVIATGLTLHGQNTYERIEDFGTYKDNWALVKLKGKYGFINQNGKEIVKPQYDQIFDFGIYRSNWALVMALVNGKKQYGFINKKGVEVVEPKYDNIFDFGSKLEGCAEVEINGAFTFINRKGQELTAR